MFFDVINDGMVKRLEKQNMRLKKSRSISSARNKNLKMKKREVSELRKRVAILEDGMVTEWCYNCKTQITVVWNIKEQGMTAFCPVCGHRMMLCDYCTGSCDYDYGKDICKEM